MLPGVIQMESRIIRRRVSHPMVSSGVHMRGIRMARCFPEILLHWPVLFGWAVLFGWTVGRGAMGFRHRSSAFRSVGRNVPAANFGVRRAMLLSTFPMVLRASYKSKR
jgi:hypothetical protein